MTSDTCLIRAACSRSAAARLAYRDACRDGDDAGPRFFEMLGAQLAEPWTVLRIVSAVMDHPTESYLSGSELAAFATRLMDSVDANLKLVAAFDLNGGAPTGAADPKGALSRSSSAPSSR